MNLRFMWNEASLSSKAEQFRRVFFYRICGAGMTPAACLMREKGFHVEGYDLYFHPPLGPALQKMGIPCYGREQITVEFLQSFDLIVVGNIVPRESEEARMIERLGVPFCSFPAALGALVLKDRNVVGICGTHGKTTTTYFALQVFEFLGESPGYFIGGALDKRPSAQLGTESRFFIESDEYDSAYFHKISKFRSYHIDSMILTSLEFDHADIFSSLDEIQKQFQPVVAKLELPVICCDRYLAAQKLMKTKEIIWYGTRRLTIVEESDQGTRFTLEWQGDQLFFQTNIVGCYNIENITAVLLYALSEGFPYERLLEAVKNLRQVKRRQELRGYYRGCPVIDDFAHHPRSVQLTINAIKVSYPDRKIHVIFEPASATARSSVFQKEFSQSFDGAGSVLIMRPAGPSTVKNFGTINWRQLQKDLSCKSREKVAIGHELSEVIEFIQENAVGKSLFLVLGNGTCAGIWESEFVDQLQQR